MADALMPCRRVLGHLCIVLLTGLAATAALANDGRAQWRDPMRAPAALAPTPATGDALRDGARQTGDAAAAEVLPQVWSIRRTEGAAAQAWIGETRVTVGARMGDWRVHTIHSDAVVLQSVTDRKEFRRLSLHPIEIRRAAGSP